MSVVVFVVGLIVEVKNDEVHHQAGQTKALGSEARAVVGSLIVVHHEVEVEAAGLIVVVIGVAGVHAKAGASTSTSSARSL